MEILSSVEFNPLTFMSSYKLVNGKIKNKLLNKCEIVLGKGKYTKLLTLLNPYYCDCDFSVEHINDIELFVGKYSQVLNVIIKFKINLQESLKLIKVINKKAGVLSNNVKTLLLRSNGNVWIGTDKGVSVFDGLKLKRNVTKNNGLASNKILSLAEDNKGNVWIGTVNGLSVELRDTIVNVGISDGLEQLRIKSVLIDRLNNVWIGTRNGVGKLEVQNLKEKHFKTKWFTQKNGLSNNRIRCLYEDISGAIWIGTYFGGVNMLFNEYFTLQKNSHGLTDDAISYVKESNFDSSIWLGVYGAGINVLTDTSIISVSVKEGLSSDYINAIVHIDSLSTLVGTDDGINLLINNEVVEVLDSYNGIFKSNKITHIAGDSNLCFGLTAKHEVFAFNVDSVFRYDSIFTSYINHQIDDRINAIYHLNNY